jgi:hypothetical protein
VTLRYRRHADLRLTALEGEGVVLHLGARRYFTVTESGLTILEALNAPKTFDELVAAVVERYEVSADHAAASVRAFVDRCCAADLLVAEQDA